MRGLLLVMPIRRVDLAFYAIDWPELSAVIRSERAIVAREWAAYREVVFHLGDGR